MFNHADSCPATRKVCLCDLIRKKARREMATQFMSAMLAANKTHNSYQSVAQSAVMAADALIKTLEVSDG